MAYKATSAFLALILIANILLATTWQAVASWNIPDSSKTQKDKKQPEWFFHSEGGAFPGIGVGLPFTPTPETPYNGGNSGGPGSGHSYVPGGDDTIVPNPGFEVPNPGSGGEVAPTPTHP